MSASYSSQKGGRHLAPKTPKNVARPRRPKAAQTSVARPRPARPTAEELGTSTANVIRTAGNKAGGALTSFLATCREWGSQAGAGLKEAIDMGNFAAEIESPNRLSRAPAHTATSHELRPSSVGLLERSSEDTGIEVSMLESLGFYSDDTAMVVAVAPTPPGVAPAAHSRSQVPDLEINDWRPHVISRSKLGSGRLSTAMVIGLSVSLLVLIAMVITLLRAPADTAVRQTNELSASATDLAESLSRLDAVVASPSDEVSESTALLLNVERSARDLFDRAAQLPDESVGRQAAIGAAQSALALETALGDALAYRVVLQPLWASPNLAPITDSAEAAEVLAGWQVELGNLVESFPTNPALESHQTQVAAFVGGFDAWRIGYLDALTASDSATADAGLADLEGQLALLAQAGEESLGAIFTAADAERSRLVRSLATIAG